MSSNIQNKVEVFKEFYLFTCPHCAIQIVVMKNELNCKIFRCGQFKSSGDPVPPHAPKTICDKLKAEDLINGCGKPFIFNGTCVEICGYI